MTMNRIFNYCTALLLSALTLSLGSCTEEYEYTGTTADGQQVYFSNNLESQIDLSPTQTSVTVPVNRIQRGGALTVDLNVTVEEGSQLSVSNQVTFNDGDSVAYITINYDPNVIEYGDYDSITVSIPDASLTTPYGNTSYTFTAGLSEWETLGTGLYCDPFFSGFYGVDMLTYSVRIDESVITPGRYRIYNPYGSGTSFYTSFVGDNATVMPFFDEVSDGRDHSCIIDASDPNYVYMSGDFFTGLDDTRGTQGTGYGHMHLFSMVDDYLRAGLTLEAIKAEYPDIFGRLSNGVITFGEQAVLVNYDESYEALGYLSTSNWAIALPGYEITDYSSAFTYKGCFTDVAGNSYAQGTITLGDDVASASYIIAGEGDDIAAIVEGIADGSVEPTGEVTASGDVSIPLSESGNYTMVIVTFNASGEMQSNSVTQFTFTTSTTNVDWQVECEGTYDQNFLPNFITNTDNTYVGNPLGSGTYTTTLYVDADDPNHFKLEPWLIQTGHLEFNVDENGIISFNTFDTGVDTGSEYGNMFVLNADEYFGASEQGQPVSFYAQEGYFVFGCMYFAYMNGQYGWMGGAMEVFAPEGVDMPEKQSAPIDLSRNQLKNNKVQAKSPIAGYTYKGIKAAKANTGKSHLKARPFRMK